MLSARDNTKVIHYGNDRQITRDGFELCLSQVFLGPVEIELNDKEFNPLQFSYGDVETKEDTKFPYGMISFHCIVKNKMPLLFRIMFQFLEGIQIYPPTNDTNSTGAIIIKIARKGLLQLRRSLGVSSEVAKNHPLSYPAGEDVYSSIIFVLKSWNEVNIKHYLRLLTKPHIFRGFDELHMRFTKWLAVIRDEDIKHIESPHRWSTENPFIKTLNTVEWLDIMKRNNLIADNKSDSRIIKYKYYRPGHLPSTALPKTRAVEIQSMYNSPEKKFNWLSSIPCKDINVAAAGNNTIENHVITKRLAMDHQAPLVKRRRNLGQITIDDEEKSSEDNQNRKKCVKSTETVTKCTTLLKYGSGKTNISLSMGDVGKLSPEQLLNDSIIEFYLRYLAHECYPVNDELYIFNTFLFPRLISHPTKSVTGTTIRSIINRNAWLKKNYESVKRWTKGVDIFSKKFLIIPVNYDDHWYVIIVQNPGKAVREGVASTAVNPEKQAVDASDACTIFVFNSLHMLRCSILKISFDVIKEYLTLEFADKNQQKDRHFSRMHVVEVPVEDISGQKNLFDCGVFLLAYTELFITWTPKIKEFFFNFNEMWPLFQETQMARMRYKILKVLRSKVSHEMWKRLGDFESKEHEDGFSTEQRLLYQLEKRGLRRWQSQVDIRERPRFKKRSKSLDRVDLEDHLNPTWDPIFE